METVELMLLEQWNALTDSAKRMIGHEGQADILMNPCTGHPLLSRFQNATSEMLEEVKGLNQYETQSGKLARKMRESPSFGIGLLAMAGVCAAGAYRFRRGMVTLPTPQYLMQLRVCAQGACVGSLVAGTAYTMAMQAINNRVED